MKNVISAQVASRTPTHLEEIDGCPGVQAGLLVDGSHDCRFLRLGRVERSSQVKLQTLCDLVLQLELSSEEVGGGPGLHLGSAKTRYCGPPAHLGKGLSHY